MTGTAPLKRPKVTEGDTIRYQTGCGWIYITINQIDNHPMEVFAHLGKTGQCGAAQIEAIGRAISIGLRAGVDPMAYVKQFKGIRCPSIGYDEGEPILSCADAIAKAIERSIPCES